MKCKQCGYNDGFLKSWYVCPECGKPTVYSRQRNVGSPYDSSARKAGFRLSVAAVALLGIVALLTTLYHANPELRPTLEFGTAVLGGAGAVFGIIYGFHRSAVSIRQARRHRSLEIIDQLNGRSLIQARVELAAGIGDADDGYAYVDEDPERLADACYLLGLLEDLALSIRTRLADEQVLYDSLSFMIPTILDEFRPFIDGMRRRHDDATIFEEIENLARQWTGGMSLATSRPLEHVTIGRALAMTPLDSEQGESV